MCMPRRATLVEPNLRIARRLLEQAVLTLGPMSTPCMIDRRQPSRSRPTITVQGRQIAASRLVAATNLGRPITPEEDVDHLCHMPRCLQGSHLEVKPWRAHQERHVVLQRQDRCSIHDRPYDRWNSRGWGVCLLCQREAAARWRAGNPDKVEAYRRSEAGREAARRAGRRYAQTERGRAVLAAKQRQRRQRLRQTESSPTVDPS